MQTYRQFVVFQQFTESISSPVEWEWNFRQQTSASATFWIGEKVYTVTFDHRQGNMNDGPDKVKKSIWQVNFKLFRNHNDETGTIEITGTGDGFKVFATVGQIVEEFMGVYKPDVLEFNAKEPSRKRLYARLAQLAATQVGGYIGREAHGDGGYGWFEVVKQ